MEELIMLLADRIDMMLFRGGAAMVVCSIGDGKVADMMGCTMTGVWASGISGVRGSKMPGVGDSETASSTGLGSSLDNRRAKLMKLEGRD